MPQGISQRAFAKLEGVSRTLVRRKIDSGHLKAFGDGSLDPALVGSGWHKDTADLELAARASVDSTTEIPSKAESEARKEFFLAKLRQLEFERESGKLAPVGEMSRAIAKAFGAVRARMLAIPSKVAPLAAGGTPAAVEAVVRDAVYDALNEMAHTTPEQTASILGTGPEAPPEPEAANGNAPPKVAKGRRAKRKAA